MPIKGISDVRRLPRIGKVRLGVKAISKKTKREYPKAVDYFVVTAEDNITFKSAAESFHQVYGEKPRALEIMFPLNDTERFFQQWYRRYGSGTGLICKGDAETAWEVNRDTGEMLERECNPAECEWVEKKHCRPIGTLMFLLPQVDGLGCWQLDTSSWNSIVNINSAIEFIKRVTDGNIAMIPLTLALRPKDVQPEGKKKTVWILDLALEGMTMEQLLKPPDLKTYYLPPDTMAEVPDDLYPASMQIKTDAEDTIEAEAEDTKLIVEAQEELLDTETYPMPEAGVEAIKEQLPQARVRGVKLGNYKQATHDVWRGKLDALAKDIIGKGERGMTQPDYEAILDWLYEETLTQRRCAEAKERLLAWEPSEAEPKPAQGEIEF